MWDESWGGNGVKVEDIQAMLDHLASRTGKLIHDGKANVKFLNGDCVHVKMSFVIRPRGDQKTPSLMDQFRAEVQELEAKTGKPIELKCPQEEAE
jgi:hypothetical protein